MLASLVTGIITFAAGLYAGYQVGTRSEARNIGPFAAIKSFFKRS